MIITKDKHSFLQQCYKISDTLGKKSDLIILGKELPGNVYEDDLIYIALSEDRQYMEVGRKLTSDSIIYVQEGSIIRADSDFIYLIEHVQKLTEKTVT